MGFVSMELTSKLGKYDNLEIIVNCGTREAAMFVILIRVHYNARRANGEEF